MTQTRLQSFLDERDATYRMSHHDIAYTAQDLAMAEHVPGRRVIKPVLVRADGQFVLCALPACDTADHEVLPPLERICQTAWPALQKRGRDAHRRKLQQAHSCMPRPRISVLELSVNA